MLAPLPAGASRQLSTRTKLPVFLLNPGTVQHLKKACPAKVVVGPQGRQLIYPVEAELLIVAIHRRGKIRRVEVER